MYTKVEGGKCKQECCHTLRKNMRKVLSCKNYILEQVRKQIVGRDLSLRFLSQLVL